MSESVRVAVIGTGAVGAMAAWRLAVHGATVCAFDAFAPGHDRGAAAGESRIFRTAYKEGAAYVPLLRQAESLWSELETASDRALYERRGGLTIGPADDPDVRTVLDGARDQQLAHDVLDAQQLRGRYPQYRVDEDEIAVFDHAAGLIRPEIAVQCAWTVASRHGARLVPYQPVRSVAARASGWRVGTENETVDVDHVVFAPGPWAPLLEPLRSLPVTIEQITPYWFPARDVAAHRPDQLPLAIRRHRSGIGFSAYPVLDGVSMKVIPHHVERPRLNDPADLPRTVSPERARAVGADAASLLPGVDPHPVRIATYAEGFTPDGHGIVGPLPGQDNATVLTGFSGHGFKLSPVFGEIAADHVFTGSSEHALRELAPARFPT